MKRITKKRTMSGTLTVDFLLSNPGEFPLDNPNNGTYSFKYDKASTIETMNTVIALVFLKTNDSILRDNMELILKMVDTSGYSIHFNDDGMDEPTKFFLNTLNESTYGNESDKNASLKDILQKVFHEVHDFLSCNCIDTNDTAIWKEMVLGVEELHFIKRR